MAMNSRRAVLLICALALSGCGLKGDLYIPEPTEPEPAAQDADAEETNGSDAED